MTRDLRAIAAAVPVTVVAVIAGVVSYAHIEALALAEHQPLDAARLLPFSVDFLIVAGSVILLAGSALGWLAVALGVAATVFANVESGLPYGPLAAIVAAWPAIAFSVASFTLERWLKAQAGRPARVAQGGTEAAGTHGVESIPGALAEPEPSQPEPVASQGGQGGPEVAQIHEPLTDSAAPEEPGPDHSEPPEPPSGQCGHTVAGTPEENVVRAFLHGRDCLGEPPSQRKLAERFGLSRPRVAQLVGSLNGHAPEP